jgi:hypothetical protein
MNATEITRMLAMFDAAYGSKMKTEGRSWELSVEIWTLVLADIPWTPYGENAVTSWFAAESWPPTPADIRGLVLSAQYDERVAANRARDAHIAAAHARPDIPIGHHDTSLPGLIHEWNRRRKLGLPEGAPLPPETEDAPDA